MDDREVFVAVAEAGSFTVAARALGISTSYASRCVRSLESRLGVALMVRSTRQQRLTEAGARYLAQVGPLLQGLEEADAAARQQRVEPAGLLRVASPLSFGLRHVEPVITTLLCQHPGLRVEVDFDDRRTDPMRYDVTIRGGELHDAQLVARRLCGLSSWVVATPDYVARHPPVEHPRDLGGRQVLHYTGGTALSRWTLRRGADEVHVDVVPRLSANSGDGLLAACEAGLGPTLQPEFLVQAAVDEGRLVRLLPDWSGHDSAFWALWPSRHPSAAVRALVEGLVERLSA